MLGLGVTAAVLVALGQAGPPEVSRPGPQPVRAEPDRHGALAIGAGTDFPISVGGYLRSELGPRIQLGASLGFLPRSYFETLNDTLMRYDAYDASTGALLQTALKNALVARAQLGWRPFPRSGFYLAGSYTWIGLGGDISGAEALQALSGSGTSFEVLEGLQLEASAVAHQAGGELGWRWRLGDVLALEAALGGFYTFDARSDLTLAAADGGEVLLADVLLPLGEDYLNDQMQRYLHGGYVSLRGYFELF